MGQHFLIALRRPLGVCAAALAALLAATAAGRSQPVRFVSEEIIIRVGGDSCQVEGTYSFANAGDHEAVVRLSYPFAVSETLPQPTTVDVRILETDERIRYSSARGAVLFSLSLPPHQARTTCVRYWQRTPGGSMTYLLTTTRQWDAPLDEARFTIVVPLAFELRFSSYALGAPEEHDGARAYRFRRSRFVPAHDLTIQWRRSSP